MRIGIISDTHSFLDERVFKHFADVDEIWHAGDIGDTSVTDKLIDFKPLVAVYGNIDNKTLQLQFPEIALFKREGLTILMIHIAGKTGYYTTHLKEIIRTHKPNILVCGHSHILKVSQDPKFNNLLYINPGAAGNHGFHTVKTLVKLDIINGKISNMQAIELGRRGIPEVESGKD
jgi:uncharacterized protein